MIAEEFIDQLRAPIGNRMNMGLMHTDCHFNSAPQEKPGNIELRPAC